jgi:hypothetical protein
MTESTLTMPAETGGTAITRFNALKHGILSRYTVLPWEDPEEYRALVAALTGEHTPQGPTEEHLVEELAGILWRKRRLRLAEAAAHRRGFEHALEPYRKTVEVALAHLDATDQSEQASDAVHATAVDTAAEIVDIEGEEAMTRRALDLLGSRRNDAYEAALASLRDDTTEWWEEMLACDLNDLDEEEEPARPDAHSLRWFLEHQALAWFKTRRKELGEPLPDPRPGLRRGARPRSARQACPLRGAPRPQARTHPRHAAQTPGSAAYHHARCSGLIRFAKRLSNDTKRALHAAPYTKEHVEMLG